MDFGQHKKKCEIKKAGKKNKIIRECNTKYPLFLYETVTDN